jgi:hypothetical protein
MVTGRSERVVGKKPMKKSAGKDAVTVVVMRLYVAGRAPNSVKAIANLEAICRQHLKDGYKLEIVDVRVDRHDDSGVELRHFARRQAEIAALCAPDRKRYFADADARQAGRIAQATDQEPASRGAGGLGGIEFPDDRR